MWRYLLAAAVTAVIMIAIYGPRSSGASASTFEWSGAVGPAQWVNVQNANGRVRIEPAEDDSVRVHAAIRRQRRDRGVRVVVNEADGNLYVCPVASDRGRCGPDGYSSGATRGPRRLFGGRANMHVDFTVKVPRGVYADGSSTNGSLSITGISGQARARTVNGRIELSDIFGPVTARSTNGAIRVRLDSLPGDAALSFRTTNGSITAELPAELAADIEMATTNGRINSSFPITVSDQMSSRRLSGRIGAGGREISIQTTNGSITLRPVSGGAASTTSTVQTSVGVADEDEAASDSEAPAAAAAEADTVPR